jgi:hypothetical protein
MKLTRKEWLQAAFTLPLQFGALAELAAQNHSVGAAGAIRRAFALPPLQARPDPSLALPPLGPAPALPDKASFPRIAGTSLDAAATHPRPEGANDLMRKRTRRSWASPAASPQRDPHPRELREARERGPDRDCPRAGHTDCRVVCRERARHQPGTSRPRRERLLAFRRVADRCTRTWPGAASTSRGSRSRTTASWTTTLTARS